MMKRFLTPKTSTPVRRNSQKKRKRTRRKVNLQYRSIPEKTMLKALRQKLIRKKVKSPLVVLEDSLLQPLKMTKKKMTAKISSTTVTTMNKESTSGELKVTTGISTTTRTKKLMN